MAGILSKPPKSTHAERAAYNKKHGAGAWAAKIGKAPSASPVSEPAPMPGLTEPQQGIIEGLEYGDEQLGGFANGMLPEIEQSFEQPFDWQKYEQMAPVTGDYNQWVTDQMQSYNNAFDERMNPQFQQQTESFEQTMKNRGIPMGSELYNREKSRMEQSQNDARTQAYAANQGQAIQGAQSLFGIGTEAQQNALGLGQAARYGSLNDFNAMRGAMSGMAGQNLGFTQQMQLGQQGFGYQQQLQDAQNKAQMQQLKFAAKNRGGGGAPVPAWQQMGFSSYQDAEAFNEAQRRDAQMWNWQNAPSAPSGPSTGSQVGGAILGTGLNLLGQYASKNWF